MRWWNKHNDSLVSAGFGERVLVNEIKKNSKAR
jgi:hypothetical protein